MSTPAPTASDPVLAVAVRAARRAASVIIDASRDLRRLPTFSKEHGDIVSGADREAESAIAATIGAAFPEHAVLSEESGEIRPGHLDSAYRWVVDPIDGSLNFVHGFPYYAVSIALTKNDEVTHAVVLDPVHDELFTAIKGKGAQRNGAPIHVSACTARASTTRSWARCSRRGAAPSCPPTCRCSTRWSRNARACGAPARCALELARSSPAAAWTASG